MVNALKKTQIDTHFSNCFCSLLILAIVFDFLELKRKRCAFHFHLHSRCNTTANHQEMSLKSNGPYFRHNEFVFGLEVVESEERFAIAAL